MPILIHNAQARRVRTTTLRQATNRLLKAEAPSRAEVSVLLVDDATMQEMNRDYRGYDKTTDVLSFAQGERVDDSPPPPVLPGEPTLLGDVVISVDTALRQSTTHGFTLEAEMALLCVHGVLHLLGYEDETEEGSQQMRERERLYLGIQYPDPTN